MTDKRIKVIKEINKIHDKLWQQTIQRFKKLGITYDDPRGVDLFGENQYNKLLDRYKNSLNENRINHIRKIINHE